ncbi:MAG: alpha/beta hydrolase [Dehalococcoidia bacterium]|nr:alpha/beta hydrolase [Dehalococcoidia bacterium]
MERVLRPLLFVRVFGAAVVGAAMLVAACGGTSIAPDTGVQATLTAPAASSTPATEGSPSTAPVVEPPARLGSPTGRPHTAKPPDFEAVPGATADFGTLGQSVYRVEMPADWNKKLVLYAHGVRLNTTELSVTSPERALREAWIAEGYAWAASSYSENEYVPGIGADDTLALLDFVAEKYGEPEAVYLYGVSMGGHVTALLLEHYPERFDGALAVCGAMGGQEQIDYLLAWGMAAEYISGVELPIGGGVAAMAAALTQRVTAQLGTPDAPTAKGKQFQSVARELSGGARPFFYEGILEHYSLNFGLLLIDPNRTSLIGRAATNAGVEYGIDDALGISDAQLNEGIRRLEADPAVRDPQAYPDAVPTTGRIEDPLLTLHNTGDLFVPITHEVSYLEKVTAEGNADLLVQRAIRAPGHCQFSDEELLTAWSDLQAWVEDGERPRGDDFSDSLADAGREWTVPLRPGDPGTP